MAEIVSGPEVVRQATDNSLGNTEPAIVAGAVVGIVGAVGSILVIGGYIDDSQSQQLKDAAGQIIPALFIVAAVVQAAWTRMKVYSPRSAAQIAIVNAKAPAETPPTLVGPP
jgi:nitrate/nitrite transporter NarK